MSEPTRDERSAVRYVATYKLVKSCLQLGLAAALLGSGPLATDRWLHDIASVVQTHFHAVWCMRAAAWMLSVATPHHVVVLAVGLLLDGALGLFEGFALRRNWPYASWFVVFATALPLPWELHALLERPRVGHLVLLAVNLGIVCILISARRSQLASRARRA
jgi:uncharacterized membrane protein (DUF2068 family)